MRVSDLGDMEIVSNTSSGRHKASQHILALEKRVDDLIEENRNLRRELTAKPSTVTQENLPSVSRQVYDKLCQKLQECYKETIPF